MAKPRLVISAAHTSVSPGSIFQDLREYDLTKKLLSKIEPHLKSNGIEHKIVPVDLNLLQRIDWINKTGYKEKDGDIFIELHVNDGNKRGIEAWYNEESSEYNKSQKLAEFLLEEITKSSGYESQGAKSEYDHELGSLLILNQTDQISTAFEFLYLDNPEDIKILKDDAKVDDLMKKFAEAIKKYIDNPPIVKDNPSPKPKKPGFQVGGGNKPGGGLGNFGGFGGFGGGGGLGGFGGFGDDDDSDSSGSSVTMDREERKKMITKNYKKYLGREPKQSDINYFLNIGISEEDLNKKILKSKDHEEIVKDAKEADELRKKFNKQESELIRLKNQVNDLQKMHGNLNTLLQHKNLQIKQMQDELVRRGITRQGEYFDPNRVQR